MNTFDVFDTLVARRFLTSHPLWELMGQEFKIDNFVSKRPIPDNGGRSLAQIYDELDRLKMIPSNLKQEMMRREVELEIENCYGIKETIDEVNDGDLLVSDMYLPARDILQIVRSAGLTKQVTIYQSNGDKSNGSFWNKIKSEPPYFHCGDNIHSDINQAKSHGINTKFFDKSKPTNLEQNLQILGLLIREIRLTNTPISHRQYFDLSLQINLPMIFIMLEQLHRSVKNKSIVFLGRDCQLMWKIYNAYYGTAYYLPFSRKIAYANPKLAVEYLRNHYNDETVLIDISSTGETWTHLFNHGGNFNIKCIIHGDNKQRPYLPKSFSYITKGSLLDEPNTMLEIMNCANHGYIDNLTAISDNIIIASYANPEIPREIISTIHLPIDSACKLSKYYKNSVRNFLKSISDDNLTKSFKQLSSIICSNLHLRDSIPGFLHKDTEYFSEILRIRENIKL